MAQLTSTAVTKADIVGSWAENWRRKLEANVSQWKSLDWLDQEVFHLEWFGVVEPRLARLRTGEESLQPSEQHAVRALELARATHSHFLTEVEAGN